MYCFVGRLPLAVRFVSTPVSMSIRLKATTNSSSASSEPLGDSQAGSVASSFATVKLRGMPIHVVTKEEVVNHIIDCSARNTGGWVVTPNLDILRRHARSTSFRNLVATSSLNVPDGMPLVWASRIKGKPLRERVNGTDLMIDLCRATSEHGQSVFFLGGNPGAAEGAAAIMQKDFPDLRVAGCYCPEFGFEKDVDNVDKIAEVLAEAAPDIVFVGLGSPKQDVLINMLRLKFPNVWWLGVGVSFSFVSGEIGRAPEWAKNGGFEWLYRLLQKPKRLANRYLLQGVPFFAATLTISIFERFLSRE